MKIGLSLPLSYLVDEQAQGDTQHFTQALGPAQQALPELKSHGVESIELQKFDHASNPQQILQAAQRIINAGLTVTLHGYLPMPNAADSTPQPQPTLPVLLPPLMPALHLLHQHQDTLIMVVHAHADQAMTMAQSITANREVLAHLTQAIDKSDIALQIALEINRYHGFVTPGVTYDGILAMADPSSRQTLGLCWDMGHTQSSILQHQLPASPPADFVQQVIHTHIHGLSPQGNTHLPVTDTSGHITAGLQHLRDVGYQGIANLELYPVRWPISHSIRHGILSSIKTLRSFIRNLH